MTQVTLVQPTTSEEIQPVTLSACALRYVKQKLKERSKGLGLRFGVKSAGCSGFKYLIDYQDELPPEDYCFPTEDPCILIFVDRKSYPFVKGTEIDYVEDKFNSHFEYHNPNVKSACGCGESFGT